MTDKVHITHVSPHLFSPGERVRYSVIVKSFAKGRSIHHTGFGYVMTKCGGEKDRPAYLVRTPQGKVKMLFANELSRAPVANQPKG